MSVITDDCQKKTYHAGSDSREASQSQPHVQVQPVARLKNLLLRGRCTHHALTLMATSITDRQTECSHWQLHPALLSSWVSESKTSVQLHCQYRPSGLTGTPWPPNIQPHCSLACRGTQTHVHISTLTLQSLQQLIRTPWWPQQPSSSWLLEMQAYAPALSLFTHLPAISVWSSPPATWSHTCSSTTTQINRSPIPLQRLTFGFTPSMKCPQLVWRPGVPQASRPGSKPNYWHPNLHMLQLLAPWTHGPSNPVWL